MFERRRDVVLFVGALRALLRAQLRNWTTTVRKEMRGLVAFVCSLLALASGSILNQLPNGWLDVLVANLFSPAGVYVALMLLLIAAFGFFFTTITAKVARTL